MKVTVKEKSTEKEYPWIGISENGRIVLFVGDKEGMVIDENNFGQYSYGWCESNFKLFQGEIVLSNS